MIQNVRQVSGLQWAESCPASPLPKPKSAAAKNGLAFQKKVGKVLQAAAIPVGAILTAEPWFRFYDDLGQGQAVPDFILEVSDISLIIEVKYTFTQEGVIKLRSLYMPVVKATKPRPRIRPLLICRNLIRAEDMTGVKIISKLGEALTHSSNSIPVLQYLGQGPIRW